MRAKGRGVSEGSQRACVQQLGNMSDQATKEFTPAPPASAKASQMSIAELGLMVGAADPMMLFPAGTTFTPYSVLRNISDAPMAVTPTLCWMEAGLARSEAFPSLALRPGRSQSLNLMSLISAAGLKNFSGSVNLAFDVQGKEGGLLLAAGSVDQSGTYVFRGGSPRHSRGRFEVGGLLEHRKRR